MFSLIPKIFANGDNGNVIPINILPFPENYETKPEF